MGLKRNLILCFSSIMRFVSGENCISCSVEHLRGFDDILVTDDQIVSNPVSSWQMCFLICYGDENCLSFQHNLDTSECRTYGSNFISTAYTSGAAVAGNKLYRTCRAANKFGSACSTSADCHTFENSCIGGLCQCSTGRTDRGWNCDDYVGCYQDSFPRLLPDAKLVQNDMTIRKCVTNFYCASNNRKYAGVNGGRECYCGNTIQAGFAKLDESECGQGCRGDPYKVCGGTWKISIYKTGV